MPNKRQPTQCKLHIHLRSQTMCLTKPQHKVLTQKQSERQRAGGIERERRQHRKCTQTLNTKSKFPICLAQCHWLFLVATIHRFRSCLLHCLLSVFMCVAKEGKLQFIYASLLIERFSWAKYSPRKSIETSSKRFGTKLTRFGWLYERES